MKKTIILLVLALLQIGAYSQEAARQSREKEIEQKKQELEQLYDTRDKLEDELYEQQNPWRKDEMQLDISIGTPPLIGAIIHSINTKSGWMYDDIFGPALYSENHKASPTVTLQYHARLRRWLWMGLTASYANYHQYIRRQPTYEKTPIYAQFHTNFINTMLDIRFSYLNKQKVMLYSGIGVGLMTTVTSAPQLIRHQLVQTTRASVLPMVDATLIGVQWGRRNLYGLAEFHAGMTGFARIGIGCKF